MSRWAVRTPIFSQNSPRRLALGLGLIGIGKPWGHVDDTVPEQHDVEDLLTTAVSLGVRFFDTAPSYGVSEARFGNFLRAQSPELRESIVVATKFGEHWDAERQAPFVDHSYDALTRSLDGSLERLGRIDFLELHKTNPDALRSVEVRRAFAYAASQGIRNIGASVSDMESARIALATEAFSVVQLPLNPQTTQYQSVVAGATESGILVLTNRPFGMGKLLHEGQKLTPGEAFAFLIRQRYDGVVLTGTKSARHLRENLAAFQEAVFDIA